MAGLFEVRNNNTATRQGYTPAAGELFFDNQTGQLFVGDGGTIGGRLVGTYLPFGLSSTPYTVTSADEGKLYVCGGSANILVSLGPAGSGSTLFFPAGTSFAWQNNMTGHTVTITPVTSTINGAASLILYPGDMAVIISDGTNYWGFVMRASTEVIQVNFSGLPSTAVRGMRAVILDSTTNTWGANITVGGGGDVVLAWYNGTNWTVIGK